MLEDYEIWIQLGFVVTLFVFGVIQAISVRVQKRNERKTDEINDAVNHRHQKRGPDAPKLYDAVLHLHERTDHIDQKVDKLDDKADKVNERLAKLEETSPCKQCGPE